MKVKKKIYIIVGCICLALGAIGTIIPIMPTVPFLMVTAYCFARSSEKLNSWFINTKLYKENLESYVNGQGMTRKTKIRIMVTVTMLMMIGFVMMDAVPIGRIVLTIIWAFHIVYFMFGVKNLEI